MLLVGYIAAYSDATCPAAELQNWETFGAHYRHLVILCWFIRSFPVIVVAAAATVIPAVPDCR